MSIASLYREMLERIDGRFKNRQYRFELSEEYLPDQYLHQVYTRENISAQVKQVIREYNENTAGYKLPEFSTHQLRHTFATRLCRNSSDLKSIQKILGHKDISTTMNIYADATEDGVAESMQALEGVMFRKYNSHKLNN